MGWLTVILQFGSKLIDLIMGRSTLANREDMVKAKKKQVEQSETDRMNELHHIAIHGRTAEEREAALKEIQRLQSE